MCIGCPNQPAGQVENRNREKLPVYSYIILPDVCRSPDHRHGVSADSFMEAPLSERVPATPSASPLRDKSDGDTLTATRLVPQRLMIIVQSADGLPHMAPHTDAFVSLNVKTGSRTHSRKTKVVHHSTSPEWDEVFYFDEVRFDSSEVVLLVQNRSVFLRDQHLGQVDFSLRDREIAPPRDGSLTTAHRVALVPSSSRRRQASALSGHLTFQLSWYRPDDSHGGKGSVAIESEELKDLDDDDVSLQPPKTAPIARPVEMTERDDAPEGGYQLRVHVMEARDLVPKDASGTSDPLVEVHCFGQRRFTSVKSSNNCPIWGEYLVIEADSLSSDALGAAQIEVRVCDADTGLRAELIGRYAIDALNLYYMDQHEIYQQWVALSAPQTSRPQGRGGVQGYLKLSMVLLGPGDKVAAHDAPRAAAAKDVPSVVLLPPTLKQEVRLQLAAGRAPTAALHHCLLLATRCNNDSVSLTPGYGMLHIEYRRHQLLHRWPLFVLACIRHGI